MQTKSGVARLSNQKILSFHRNKALSYLILSVITLIPAIFALYLALNAGKISSHDYWGIIGVIISEDGFSDRLTNWFIHQNGHILFLPAIIYALNIILTQGSNVGLTLTAWSLALLQTLLLIKLLPTHIQNWQTKIVLVFSISAFSFTPSAVHSWMLGFSGVHWIAANLLAIAAIASLTLYYHNQRLIWIPVSVFLAALATVTYGTAVALWLALCFGTAILLPRWRLGLVYIVSTAIAYWGYYNYIGVGVLNQESESGQSLSFFEKISSLFLYAVTYLGAIFTTNITTAFIVGLIGLLASFTVFSYLFFGGTRKIRLELYPWLLIQVYIIGNAFITAIGRSHLGIEQTMTSRYATLPGLFWASLIVTLMYFLCQTVPKLSWKLYGPAYLVTLLLILAMYPIGLARSKEFLHRISLQPLAMLSTNIGVPDDVAIYHAITISPGQFVNLIPALKTYGHIPFDKEDTSCGQINQPIPAHLIAQTSPEIINGFFDFMNRFSEYGFRVAGWAHTDGQIQCIVLLNEKNIIRGFALPGSYRPDVAEILDLSNKYTGWLGYAHSSSHEEQLKAHVLLEGHEMWIPLNGTHSPQNPGVVNPDVFTAYYYQ